MRLGAEARMQLGHGNFTQDLSLSHTHAMLYITNTLLLPNIHRYPEKKCVGEGLIDLCRTQICVCLCVCGGGGRDL